MSYFREMWENDKKKVFMLGFTILFLLLLIIGASFAFFSAQVGDGSSSKVQVLTRTNDSLMFESGKDIFLDVNTETLGLSNGNLADSTFARATLKSGNSSSVNYTYYVYLQIDSNSLKYTTRDEKAELILSVTDPNGNELGSDSIPNLKYVTVGSGDNRVSGFDITTVSGLVKIAELYNISANNTTTMHEWNITITFVNLDSDQFDNTGKAFDARVIIQKEEFKNPDLYIATTYNGSPIVPSTFGADAEIDCFGNDASYDYRYNRLIIRSINAESASCNLKYTTPSSKNYLNQKVISLVGNGQVFNENGYRYEGENPNNYIWFNNELWRIIGVFDEASHGVSGKNLVKIIRSRSLGGYAWDKNGQNDWRNASLQKLLNNSYYYRTDGTHGGNCYITSDTIQGNCNYTGTGIMDTYRDMIVDATWYLGGFSSLLNESDSKAEYKVPADQYYAKERENGSPSISSHIGLMYPSDFGYSVLASSCSRTTQLDLYFTSSCSGKSWIYGAGLEWTIMPDTYGNTGAYRIYDIGYLSTNNTSMGREVRPVLYLDDSVYVVSGTGKASDPFIIGM